MRLIIHGIAAMIGYSLTMKTHGVIEWSGAILCLGSVINAIKDLER